MALIGRADSLDQKAGTLIVGALGCHAVNSACAVFIDQPPCVSTSSSGISRALRARSLGGLGASCICQAHIFQGVGDGYSETPGLLGRTRNDTSFRRRNAIFKARLQFGCVERKELGEPFQEEPAAMPRGSRVPYLTGGPSKGSECW